jgi:hypothetical protein
MPADLRQTWDDIAHHWDDWGPPLRPCAEDLRILHSALAGWHVHNPMATVRVFLCGVTPEIVTMPWPFAIDLVGMDQAESMVRLVWPGDLPGVRRAVVGNWLDSGLAPQSQDVVIGDGGFGFFDYPDGQRALTAALRKLLHPQGLFVYRHYAQLPHRETLAEVVAAAHAGQIGNFHIFKWRLAMALQPDSHSGVRQHDIWRACMEARLDPTRLPQPGWAPRAVDTIRFYQGKEARLYFPTLDEFAALLAEAFQKIEVQYASYELAERCPVLIAHP